jgi:hypothetical protein
MENVEITIHNPVSKGCLGLGCFDVDPVERADSARHRAPASVFERDEEGHFHGKNSVSTGIQVQREY